MSFEYRSLPKKYLMFAPPFRTNQSWRDAVRTWRKRRWKDSIVWASVLDGMR
jgi:hypothetical protein